MEKILVVWINKQLPGLPPGPPLETGYTARCDKNLREVINNNNPQQPQHINSREGEGNQLPPHNINKIMNKHDEMVAILFLRQQQNVREIHIMDGGRIIYIYGCCSIFGAGSL